MRFKVPLFLLALGLTGCGDPNPVAPSPAPSTIRAPHPDFVVTPGAFCNYEGTNGATKDGKPMRCVRKPGEDRARWRSDP